MVGFNRRYAPLAELLRAEFAGVSNRVLLARVNAGPLEDNHWMHDPAEGGRLLGEGCHFVDLLSHLAGVSPSNVVAVASPSQQRPLECSDSVVAGLEYADGSVATLIYSGGGDPRLSKERIEIFGAGASAVLDDFRRLDLYRNGRRQTHKRRQDKGHRTQLQCFIDAAGGRAEPPSAESYVLSTRATLALVESLRSGLPVSLD
jgi:predicted dehydrogenase